MYTEKQVVLQELTNEVGHRHPDLTFGRHMRNLVLHNNYPEYGDLERFYRILEYNTTYRIYECFPNFHYISGDFIALCVNKTWKWDEPLCEVDYYMERFRLSLFITSVVLFVCMCTLVPDFLHFYIKKRRIKMRSAQVKTLRERYGDDYNRALPYKLRRSFSVFTINKSYLNLYEEDFLGGGYISAEQYYNRPSSLAVPQVVVICFICVTLTTTGIASIYISSVRLL